MRIGWDTYFLEIAKVVAKRSTCPRLAVGCVIIMDNKIVTTGYNGAISGSDHCTDVGCHIVNGHCMRVVHAEVNALHQLKEASWLLTLYSTHRPCVHCAVAITRHHIRRVVWEKEYNGAYER